MSTKNNITGRILAMLLTLTFAAILTSLCIERTYAETEWKTCGTCEWKIDSEKTLILRPTDGISGELDDWEESPPWRYNMDKIEKVKIMPGVKAVTCRNMFINLRLLKDIDISNLDTTDVQDMKGMFEGCEEVTKLTLNGISTSKATTMENMFQRMYRLEQVNTSALDTSNVTSMKSMFRSCGSLTSLDLSNFKTTKVNNMTTMFDACTKLENLNIEGFDTPQLQQTAGMFRSCEKLKKLDLKKINTARVWTMEWMFHGCGSLEELDLSNFKTARVRWMSELFHNCGSLKSIDLSGLDMSKTETTSQMFSGCASLKKLDLSMLNTPLNENMYAMFENCSELEELNLGDLNTSKVTRMSDMCRGCGKLKTLDISGLDTGEVQNMDGIFMNCISLTDLNLKNLKTDKIDSMRSMFSGCRSLKNLDLSGLKVPKVTSMWETFMNCDSLTGIDFGRFDSVKLEYMGNAFKGCRSLKTLDLSGINTTSLMSIPNMFNGCAALEKINLTGFHTYKVNDMEGVFNGCTALKRLDMSDFETLSAMNMADMFKDCKNLKELDLSGFETPQVDTMRGMFSGCSSLKSVDFGGCDYTDTGYTEDMFKDCDSLTSLNLGNFRGGDEFMLPPGIRLLTVKPKAKVKDDDVAHWRGVGAGTAQEPKGVEYDNMTAVMADNEKRESGDATYVKLQKDASGNWIVGSDMPDIEWEIVDKSRNSKGRVTGIQFGSGNISFDWDVADLLRSSSGYNRDMAIGCLCLSDSVKKGKAEQALKRLKLRDKNEEDGIDICDSKEYKKWGSGSARTICVRRFYRNGKPYNIITAVVRGTAGIKDSMEALDSGDFRKQAGDIADEIKKLLKVNGIDVKDDANRFLFTGHSIGGAVAALTAREIVKSGCMEKNVYAYTYASPYTLTKREASESRKNNVKNILHTEDVVTRLGDVPYLSRHGEDVRISSTGADKKELLGAEHEKIAGVPYEVSDPAWIAPHTTTAYMCLVLNKDKLEEIEENRSPGKKAEVLAERGKTVRGLFVKGAVDICVKDSDGRKVAVIESDEIKNGGSGKVEVFVYNGKKVVFIKDGKGYTVELRAKGKGKMSYAVKDTVDRSENGFEESEKIFTGIATEPGKYMTGDVSDDISGKDVKLYVVNSAGDKIREIAEDGSEKTIHKAVPNRNDKTEDAGKDKGNNTPDRRLSDKGDSSGAKNGNGGRKGTQEGRKMPGKVVGLKIKAGKKGKVLLKWKRIKNVSSYRIYRAIKAGKGKKGELKFKLIKSTNKTKFVDRKLRRGIRYVYKVRAVMKSGGKTVCGAYSAKKSARAV